MPASSVWSFEFRVSSSKLVGRNPPGGPRRSIPAKTGRAWPSAFAIESPTHRRPGRPQSRERADAALRVGTGVISPVITPRTQRLSSTAVYAAAAPQPQSSACSQRPAGYTASSSAATHSMTFRHVRKSRDAYTWVGLVLTLMAVVAGFLFTYRSDTDLPRVIPAVFTGLFFIGFAWFAKCLLVPFEMEVVVDGDEVRWGRADRLDRQERVSIRQLVRLVHDKSDNQVLGDVGSWRLLHIGDGILMRADDQSALVDFLRQSFPQLRIETT